MASQPQEMTILAIDPRHPEITDILADWTERGLLRRSVWLDPDELPDATDISQVKVRVVDEHANRVLPFSDVFGDQEVERVRLVAVRPLHEATPEPAPIADLAEFAARLRSGMLAADTPFIQINLLIPDGKVRAAPQALSASWTWNAVVSPEDRPSERAVNHGLSQPEKFHAHAAMATATVAALWRHTRNGALDSYEDQNADQYGRLVVVRPTTRLALGSHIPGRVVDRLVQVGITSLRPYILDGYQNVATDDAGRARALLRAFLPTDDFALDFRPYRGPAAPQPERSGATLRELWSALRNFTRLRIEDLRQRGRDRSEELVRRWLDAMEENIAQDPDFDPDLPPTPWEIHQLAIGVPALLPSRVPPQRFLWLPLRQLCFSLIDGGQLPKAVSEAAGGLAPMISDPGWIVRPSNEGFDLSADEQTAFGAAGQGASRVRAADPNAAKQLPDRLRRALRSAKLTDEQRTHLLDCQRRFDRWRSGGRAQSLLGLMAEHVSEELKKAVHELRAHKHAVERLEQRRGEALAEIERHHQRLRLRSKMSWTALSSAVGFVALLLVPGSWPAGTFVTGPALAAVAMVALATTAWTLGRVLLHLAAGTRLHRQLDAIEQERRHLQNAVRRWPPEADRLASVYEILTDWAEIIGWLLHRPFGLVDDSQQRDDINRATLPEAFRVGTGGARTSDLDNLIRRTAKDCFGKGWLTNLYVQLDHSVRAQVHLAGDDADPDLSPAIDMYQAEDKWSRVPHVPQVVPVNGPGDSAAEPAKPAAAPQWHARRRLLTEFRRGNCAAEARDIVVERIRAVLHTYPPEQLMPTVETGEVGPDGAAVHTPTAQFLAGVLPRPTGDEPCSPLIGEGFTPEGLLADKPRVAQVWLWHPGSVSFAVEPHTGVEVRIDDVEPQRRPDLVQVSRLDVSSRCQPEHLRLFAAQPDDPAAPDGGPSEDHAAAR